MILLFIGMINEKRPEPSEAGKTKAAEAAFELSPGGASPR